MQATMEQIDVVRRLVELHPDTFGLAHTAEDVRRIHKQGKVASLIGMEGGIPLATLWRSCVKCLNWVPDI